MAWGAAFFRNVIQAVFGTGVGSEARSFHRYDIANPRIAAALLPRGVKTLLTDLSYGGLGLRLRDESHVSWSDIPKTGPLRLVLLGQSIDIHATRAYSVGAVAGYRFHHRDPEGLLWLRLVIENLQRGAGLKVTKDGDLGDRFVSGDWTMMRGDDSTEIRFRRGKTGGIGDLEVQFEDGGKHCVFRWSESGMETSVRALGNELGDRGISTGRLDRPLLRQVAAILVGLSDARVKSLMAPILDQALKELAPTEG